MTTISSASIARMSWIGAALRSRELSIVIVLALVVAVTTAVNPAFLFSHDGWRGFLLSPSVLIVVAIGEAVVVITRNIDLSVGSVLGLTAYFSGDLFAHVHAISPVVVAGLAVLLGAVLGLVNGLIVAFVKVPSLVITLGTLYAYRGIDVLWVGGNRIFPSQLPDSFQNFGIAQVLSIPYLMVIALAVTLVAGWFMTSRRAGRELYAIGSDPDAAVLFGLHTRSLNLLPFVVSGATAGLGGYLYLANYATADSQVGSGFELQAVAAVVVGGVAIFGGSGTIWGVALGAFLLTTISNALPVLGIPSLWQQAIVGLFIVGAISIDRALFVARSRRSHSAKGAR